MLGRKCANHTARYCIVTKLVFFWFRICQKSLQLWRGFFVIGRSYVNTTENEIRERADTFIVSINHYRHHPFLCAIIIVGHCCSLDFHVCHGIGAISTGKYHPKPDGRFVVDNCNSSYCYSDTARLPTTNYCGNRNPHNGENSNNVDGNLTAL